MVRRSLPLAVRAPAFGDRLKEMLRDIAAVTGATFISEELGMKLETATARDLGTAQKVVVTKDTTTIVGRRREERGHRHPHRPDPRVP